MCKYIRRETVEGQRKKSRACPVEFFCEYKDSQPEQEGIEYHDGFCPEHPLVQCLEFKQIKYNSMGEVRKGGVSYCGYRVPAVVP